MLLLNCNVEADSRGKEGWWHIKVELVINMVKDVCDLVSDITSRLNGNKSYAGS